MLSCRAIEPKLWQRNDIFEICSSNEASYRAPILKTASELNDLYVTLHNSNMHAGLVPRPSSIKPNPLFVGGGAAYREQCAQAYAYMLCWAAKHDARALSEFLGHAHASEAKTTTSISPRTATRTEQLCLLFFLFCIAFSASQQNEQESMDTQQQQQHEVLRQQDVVALPHDDVVEPRTTDVAAAAYTFALFQILCLGAVQAMIFAVTKNKRVSAPVAAFIEEHDEDEVVVAAATTSIILSGELEMEEEEVILKCGELCIEEEQEQESVYSPVHSLDLEQEDEEQDMTDEEEQDMMDEEDDVTMPLDDSEEVSTFLSSGNEEDGEEEESPRRRTNWVTIKEHYAHVDDEEEDNVNRGPSSWFEDQDVATKAAIGAAGVLLVAGVAMRLRRWMS